MVITATDTLHNNDNSTMLEVGDLFKNAVDGKPMLIISNCGMYVGSGSTQTLSMTMDISLRNGNAENLSEKNVHSIRVIDIDRYFMKLSDWNQNIVCGMIIATADNIHDVNQILFSRTIVKLGTTTKPSDLTTPVTDINVPSRRYFVGWVQF